MKKVICCIMMLLILTNTIIPCVALNKSHTDAIEIPYDEFYNIFKNCYDFFLKTQINGPYGGDMPFPPYENGEYIYADVDEERLPGGSVKGMNELAQTIFAEDIIDEVYSFNRYDGLCQKEYVNNLPLFIVNDKDIKWFPLASSQGYLYQYYYFFPTDNPTFDEIKINDNNATGNILIWTNEDMPLYWVPIAFVKTDDGWRLGDCVIFRWMYNPKKVNINDYLIRDKSLYEQYRPNDEFDPDRLPGSPSTGDTNVARVWMLAGVSLAAIVPAVCLLRRRRRED